MKWTKRGSSVATIILDDPAMMCSSEMEKFVVYYLQKLFVICLQSA